MSAPAVAAPATAAATPRTVRRGRLALCFQEILTGGARLNATRDVPPDATGFRARVKQQVAQGEQEARKLGYAEPEIRLAQYAIIVFVDEAVLHSGSAAFSEWARMPLQVEVFGNNIGGSTFFEYLRSLMAREISEDVADVLEVYQLCLLLGFRGQYRAGGGDVDTLMARVGERIQRLRETPADLSPGWRLPAGERFDPPPDVWLTRLRIAAAATAIVAIVMFVLFSFSLGNGVEGLSALGR